VALRRGIKLPADVTEVVSGRSWARRVDGIMVEHTVTPTEAGSRLAMTVDSTGGPWSVAARLYAPVVGLIARRIVAVAERADHAR